jgi:hypothetical protein
VSSAATIQVVGIRMGLPPDEAVGPTRSVGLAACGAM